jgi:tRNA G37 N-methylase Trm5
MALLRIFCVPFEILTLEALIRKKTWSWLLAGLGSNRHIHSMATLIPALLAPASLTKHLKVFLDTTGWRDKTRLIARSTQILATDPSLLHNITSDQHGYDLTSYMATALLPQEGSAITNNTEDRQWISLWEILQDPSSPWRSVQWPPSLSDPSTQKSILLTWIDPSAFATPKHLLTQTPLERLQENITHFLTLFLTSWQAPSSSSSSSDDQDPSLLLESLPQWIASLPQKWEHYSDFTLLPPTAFVAAPWPTLLKRLQMQDQAEGYRNQIMARWEQLIQDSLQSSHIARKAIIPVQDVLRRPKIRPLTGDWKAHNKYKTWAEEDHRLLEHQDVGVLREKEGEDTNVATATDSDDSNDTTPSQETFLQAYWAETCQNHVWYRWAPMFTMFSAGNITEKERIAKSRPIFDAHGKTVVDLYAGIGYFSLVYLVHAGAKVVHACEWNPWSVQGLLQGADKNGISWKAYQGKATDKSPRERQPFEQSLLSPPHQQQQQKQQQLTRGKKRKEYGELIVYPGDNAQWIEFFEGQAHHINLGLIPSAEPGWVLGVRALCPKEGGYLHVHHNIRVGEEETFKTYLLQRLRDLFATWKQCSSCSSSSPRADRCCSSWSIDIRHVENVKSFAPLVFHYVLDVECRPVGPLLSTPPHVSPPTEQ